MKKSDPFIDSLIELYRKNLDDELKVKHTNSELIENLYLMMKESQKDGLTSEQAKELIDSGVVLMIKKQSHLGR